MEQTVVFSNRPEERAGTHLVLMLHGYGSNERDLMQIGSMIGGPFTYAGMRAPQPVGTPLAEVHDSAAVPGAAFGYQWFPLTNTLESNLRTVELASDFVIDFLDCEASQYESVTLLGFSQGMAMATSVARRRPELIHSIVGLSGFVIPDESEYFHDDEFSARRIPVFYGRGDADPVISTERSDHATQWLSEHSKVELHVYPGMAHSINPQEIEHVAQFLRSQVLSSTEKNSANN